MNGPAAGFGDLASMQAALAARLGAASDLHEHELHEYAQSALADEVPPFCITELEHDDEQWICLIHGRGVDLFRVIDVRDVAIKVERKSIGPLYGAEFVEEIKVFPPGRGWQAQIRVKHLHLDSDIALTESDADDRVFELLRSWARTPQRGPTD